MPRKKVVQETVSEDGETIRCPLCDGVNTEIWSLHWKPWVKVQTITVYCDHCDKPFRLKAEMKVTYSGRPGLAAEGDQAQKSE